MFACAKLISKKAVMYCEFVSWRDLSLGYSMYWSISIKLACLQNLCKAIFMNAACLYAAVHACKENIVERAALSDCLVRAT